jgi:hypothetical protein
MRTLAALLLFALLTLTARAAEPWLKAGDVVALVGGEDMVALAEEGWLETLVTWAQPGDRIRFRSLAWEGDTVFEQRRDLNYPALETQLDKMGATVVICEFGKMESFAGKEGVAAFTEAYEKLLARLNPAGKRRIALIPPCHLRPPQSSLLPQLPILYWHNLSVLTIASQRGYLAFQTGYWADPSYHVDNIRKYSPFVVQNFLAAQIGSQLIGTGWNTVFDGLGPMDKIEAGHRLIAAKNRLWFHYTRPQNWAFLAGNRTNQPSSRDHLDPTKRWFPEEMEQWVPLIEAKEKEIWALAAAPR